MTLCTNAVYVPGAVVLAASLRNTGTNRDIVCMVSNELEKYYRCVAVGDHKCSYGGVALDTHAVWCRLAAVCGGRGVHGAFAVCLGGFSVLGWPA